MNHLWLHLLSYHEQQMTLDAHFMVTETGKRVPRLKPLFYIFMGV